MELQVSRASRAMAQISSNVPLMWKRQKAPPAIARTAETTTKPSNQAKQHATNMHANMYEVETILTNTIE